MTLWTERKIEEEGKKCKDGRKKKSAGGVGEVLKEKKMYGDPLERVKDRGGECGGSGGKERGTHPHPPKTKRTPRKTPPTHPPPIAPQ